MINEQNKYDIINLNAKDQCKQHTMANYQQSHKNTRKHDSSEPNIYLDHCQVELYKKVPGQFWMNGT